MRRKPQIKTGVVDHLVFEGKAPFTKTLVVMAGGHGLETAAQLAATLVTRMLIQGEHELPEDVRVVVIPQAHPEACLLGSNRDMEGGDLNCSWPGAVHPSWSSEQSANRAAKVAEFLLGLNPNAIVALHAEKRGPVHAWGMESARQKLSGCVPVLVREDDSPYGLAAWGARNGILAVDLEANRLDSLETSAKDLAAKVLPVALALG